MKPQFSFLNEVLSFDLIATAASFYSYDCKRRSRGQNMSPPEIRLRRKVTVQLTLNGRDNLKNFRKKKEIDCQYLVKHRRQKTCYTVVSKAERGVWMSIFISVMRMRFLPKNRTGITLITTRRRRGHDGIRAPGFSGGGVPG